MSDYCLFEFNKIINLNGLYKYPITIFFNKTEYYIRVGCKNFTNLDEAKEESKAMDETNDAIIDIVDRIINVELG